MRSRGSLTTHGTSYLYDRQVPVVFMLPGSAPTRSDEAIATVDIAPTIGEILDLEVPEEVDGRDRSGLLQP